MAIFLNEDYENFMAFRSDEDLSEAGLRQQVKDYFRGQTRGIFFNVNAQRAYYDSKVFEPVWKNIEKNAEGKYTHRGVENGSGFDGREITVLFAFESEMPLKPSDFEFSVNEVLCPDVSCGSDLAVTDDKWQKLVCKVPEGVLQPGSSVVGVRAARKSVNAALRWCEIDIK